MILEAAVDPGDGTFASLTDMQRLKTTYNICLIDRCALFWIEPLLYKVVVLDLDTQVISFTYALKSKSAEFLSRCVELSGYSKIVRALIASTMPTSSLLYVAWRAWHCQGINFECFARFRLLRQFGTSYLSSLGRLSQTGVCTTLIFDRFTS